jgi:pimeloyl-ACP methyl ester carboxylesterase
MTSIRINNTSFEYSEYGNGEPVVLVHGSTSDYRTWQDQINDFSNHFRTITYSRRYHWPNEKIPAGADYRMSEHVNDLEILLQKLDAVPAHLIGHSYGAFLCLLLAIKNPSLIQTMVLAEPPVITLFVSNTPKPLELLTLFLKRPLTAIAILKLGMKGIEPAKKAAKRDNIEEVSRLMGRAILGEEFYNQLSESRREQVRVNTIKAELLGSGFAPLRPEELRELEIPTLLVNGEKSPNVFHHLSDRLKELLPHTKRVQIPNASHIMHEDNTEAYNKNVMSFLTNYKL